jgi:hypothetical protein
MATALKQKVVSPRYLYSLTIAALAYFPLGRVSLKYMLVLSAVVTARAA